MPRTKEVTRCSVCGIGSDQLELFIFRATDDAFGLCGDDGCTRRFFAEHHPDDFQKIAAVLCTSCEARAAVVALHTPPGPRVRDHDLCPTCLLGIFFTTRAM
jgi:hypothetical protein